MRILKVAEDDFALYTGYLKTLMPPERRRCGRESGRLNVKMEGAAILSCRPFIRRHALKAICRFRLCPRTTPSSASGDCI